jgi:small subunit ribosomal protein S6
MEEKRLYEAMFVMDINRIGNDERAFKRVIHPLIEKHGGEVLVSKKWADYEFAYPIKKLTRGSYHLIYAKIPPLKVSEFKRDCYLKEEILRVLLISAKGIPEKVVLPDGKYIELKGESGGVVTETEKEDVVS